MTKTEITDKLAEMNEQIGAELACVLLREHYKQFRHAGGAIRVVGPTLFFAFTSYPMMFNTKIEAKQLDKNIVGYVQKSLKLLQVREKDISEKGHLLSNDFLQDMVGARKQDVERLLHQLNNLKTDLFKKYFADIPVEFVENTKANTKRLS